MSNSLAIAAVTGALCDLIEKGLETQFAGEPEVSGVEVSCKPLDVARGANDKNQLNLFLYQTTPNGSCRNQPLRSGEGNQAPLPLNLYYLLTAYGSNDDDMLAHLLLGRAMRVLHDYSILHPELFIRAARNQKAPYAAQDMHRQVERVRVSPQSISLEELSRLWSLFQAKYRVSMAYQVQVVLIDSGRPQTAPLPVLSRGRMEQGDFVQLGRRPSWTALERVEIEGERPSARLGVPAGALPAGASALAGDTVTLHGSGLDGTSVSVELQGLFASGMLPAAAVQQRSSETLQLALPAEHDEWPAGPYRLRVQVQRAAAPAPPVPSNQLAVALAPRLLSAAFEPATAGDAAIAVRCSPQVRAGQRVSLLVGDRELLAAPLGGERSDSLHFPVAGPPLPAGPHLLRLRVDGVDSLLLTDYRRGEKPAFDATQQVVVP